MGKRSSRQQIADLPLAVCVTFVVTVCPLILVGWLRSTGTVASVWMGIAIGVAVSFGASFAGAALWKTRNASSDVLFSELMLWGWAQRWLGERRLSNATDVLGLKEGPPRSLSGGRLTNEERTGLLSQLASSVEARDPYTHGHSRRVARHASNIAKRMGLDAAEVAKIRTAGVIHDVGKVNLSTAVLHKEGKLTDDEFELIKRHPVEGAARVSPVGDDELTTLVRHHHERFDGAGYPSGLAGDAIPLGARIIAVADTFDAITSSRPYRRAHSHREAIAILKEDAGTQLDPDAVRAFCSCYAGTRPLALWTIMTNGPLRLASGLGGGLSAAKAASTANVMLTAAATAAVGGAALGPLVNPPARAHGETVTAVGASAAERPTTVPVAGGDGARPVQARAGGRLRGLGQTTAPGPRQGFRDGHRGRGEAAPGGAAPGQPWDLTDDGATGPSGAPGPGNGKDHGDKLKRGAARGKRKDRSRAPESGQRGAEKRGKDRPSAPVGGHRDKKDDRGDPLRQEKTAGPKGPTGPTDPTTDPTADNQEPSGSPRDLLPGVSSP